MTVFSSTSVILIGAGGHAKSVWDALNSQDMRFQAYVDPTPAPWLEKLGVKRMSEDELVALLPKKPQLVIGFLGLTVESLKKRLVIMRDYAAKGATFPHIIHSNASVSPNAIIGDGVQVLAGSVVGGYAKLAQGSVVNTGAIVEHDTNIGAGTHVAPRATVLGGVTTGECAYIGSGAVVLPNSNVSPDYLVKALSLHA